MKPITLYPHEIRRLLSTGSVTVWRPMKTQPPAYINDLHGGELSKRAPYALEDNETGIIIGVGFFDDDDRPYICPHPPCSERWVRETWAWDEVGIDVHYRADFSDKDAKEAFSDVGEKWRSPATMPRWASRLSVTVAGVEARQVQTVTDKEASNAGANNLSNPCGYADTVHFACCHDYPHMPADKFRDWWQSRYGHWNPDEWAWATTLEVKQ